MTKTYRWNLAAPAAAYDAAAEHIHPHYLEMQDTILEQMGPPSDAELLLVDLGGGSGRLAERFLERFPRARAIVVDQSPPFLEIAAQRLAKFAGRGTIVTSRLQEDWEAQLPAAPNVVVSMSAIHHLNPAEKQALYRRVYDVLAPGGRLLNGDEMRPADDEEYRNELIRWDAHMRQVVAAGLIPEGMVDLLDTWREQNITHFGRPRVSGDDYHETLSTQQQYLRAVGFRSVGAVWQQQMWTILTGDK